MQMGMEFAYHVYVRKFQVDQSYKEKRKDNVIYAANHGNAFYDAFTIIYSQKKIPVFLTRAGVFGSKAANFFLGLFYMLPIYRQRDGIKSVAKNNEIMAKCMDYLHEGYHPVAMFPEGNHNMKLGMRPLQKGISRMAFDTLETFPDMDLKIIPIGLNYSKYMSFRGNVFVKKGEPIYVKPYYDIYLENKAEGSRELIKKLSESLAELTLSIPTENYDEIFDKFEKVRSRGNDLSENFDKDKVIIDGLINGQDFPETQIDKISSTLLWVRRMAVLPIYLIALISNLLPEYILRKIVNKTVSDPHFIDSIAYAGGFFLYSLLYPLQGLILYLIVGNAGIALFYIFIIPFISKFYYHYLYDKQ